MPVYKSFTAAMKDLILPMDRVGEVMVNGIKSLIFNNEAMGKELSPKWTIRKTQNTNTKLLHTGEMARSTKYQTDKNTVSAGYDNSGSNHKPDKGNGVMTNAGMAEVHNEGNDKGLYKIPARPFLFISGEWLKIHQNNVKEFIQNYYKNKGII